MPRTVLILVAGLAALVVAWLVLQASGFFGEAGAELDVEDGARSSDEDLRDVSREVRPGAAAALAERREHLERGLAEVVGTVVEAGSRRPLGDVLVEVVREGDRDVESTRTSADGTFVAMPIAPTPRAWVSVRAPSRGTVVLGPLTLLAGDSRDLGTVELGPGGLLFGRVTDDAGHPVPGARVVLRPVEPPRSLGHLFRTLPLLFDELVATAETLSDDDGNYRLESVPAGGWQVSASASGHADFHRADVWVNPAGQPTRLDVRLASGCRVAGKVVDAAQRGLGGLRVCIIPSEDDQELTIIHHKALSVTGPDGRFSIDGLAPGPKRLLVLSDGGLVHTEDPFIAPRDDVLVTLATGNEVEGLVLDATTGERLAGVEITFIGQHDFHTVTSAEDGSYRAGPMKPQTYKIMVEPKRPHRTFVGEKPEVEVQGSTRWDVPLGEGATVTGRVLDDRTGLPVPGAEISASETWGFGVRVARARSGADGTFTLRGVGPNDVVVYARAPGYSFDHHRQKTRHGELKLKAGDRREGVDVRLEPLVVVQGRVTDDRGAPVAGAHVRSALRDGFFSTMLGARRRRVVTKEDGVYSLSTDVDRDGNVTLRVSHPAFAPAAVRFENVAGGTTLRRDVVLGGARRVTGSVVGSDGKPRVGVRVRAVFAKKTGLAVRTRQERDRLSFATTTDPRGAFEMRLPGPKCRLEIVADGLHVFDGNRRLVKAGEDVVTPPFVVAEETRIEGRVTDERGRRLPKGTKVSVQRRDPDGRGWRGDYELEADGRFDADGVPRGSYQLTVVPPKKHRSRYVPASQVMPGVEGGTVGLRFIVRLR